MVADAERLGRQLVSSEVSVLFRVSDLASVACPKLAIFVDFFGGL